MPGIFDVWLGDLSLTVVAWSLFSTFVFSRFTGYQMLFTITTHVLSSPSIKVNQKYNSQQNTTCNTNLNQNDGVEVTK